MENVFLETRKQENTLLNKEMYMDKRDVLVVIDMQNDFITGSLGTKEAQNIIPNVVNKISSYDPLYVFYTRDIHKADEYFNTLEGKKLPVLHCVDREHGSWIHPSILNLNIVNKNIFDKKYFGSENLATYLSFLHTHNIWINKIEIIGLVTDICVITNALLIRTFLPEVEIVVDASCCAGTTPERHKAALEVMKSCQIEIINE